MDKLMLCLANSYKHGGRCIAGIELAKDPLGCLTIVKGADGTPKWLRPISHSFAGEISNNEARNIKVLSVIRIINIKEAGLYSHTEDIYYDRLEITNEIFVNSNDKLNQCIDNYHRNIFGNRGKAVTPESFQNGNYSVMLIKVSNAEIYVDTRFEKSKQRIKFVFYNNEYDLPITDPLFLERLKYNSGLNKVYTSLYVVLSLGIEHEGWHSKLVASIIEPISNINNILSVDNFKVKNVITPRENESEILIKNLRKNNISHKIKADDRKIIDLPKIEPIKYEPILNSKNIDIDNLLSESKSKPQREGCYIATMVYGDYNHPKVLILRNFRDRDLYSTKIGTFFVKFYYLISPKLVKILRGHNKVNKFIKRLLDLFIKALRRRSL